MRLFCALVVVLCAADRCVGRLAVYGQGAFVRRRWNDTAGWLQLVWAVVLHRTVARREQWYRWQARRNLALCRAEDRGLPPREIASRIGLSEGWVKQKIKAGKKVEEVGVDAAVEEGAAEEGAA